MRLLLLYNSYSQLHVLISLQALETSRFACVHLVLNAQERIHVLREPVKWRSRDFVRLAQQLGGYSVLSL